MEENLKIKGRVKVSSFSEADGDIVLSLMRQGKTVHEITKFIHPIEVESFDNMVVNGGKVAVANLLAGIGSATPLTYLVIGNGSGTVASTDTQLFSEQLRLQITSMTIDTLTGIKVLAETYVGVNDGNFNWTELGLVSGGSDTANSGTLFSKVAQSVSKTNVMTKTVSWEISLT